MGRYESVKARFLDGRPLRNIPYRDTIYFIEKVIGCSLKRQEGQGNGSHAQYEILDKRGVLHTLTIPYQDPLRPIYNKKAVMLYHEIVD